MSNSREVVLKDKDALFMESVLIDGENSYKNAITTINGIAQEPDTSCNHLNKAYYKNLGCLILSEAEAYKIISDNNVAKHTKEFVEIKEDSYYNLLEMLPPKNFQSSKNGNMFLVSEYTFANITNVVIEHKGRYFKACKADTILYETHIENIEARFFRGTK